MDNGKKSYVKGLITGLTVSVVCIVVFVAAWTLKLNNVVLDYFGVSLLQLKSDRLEISSDEFQDKMDEVTSCLSRFYLEGVDEETLAEGAFKGVVEALDDPYSEYYTEEEYEKLTESTNGEYNGIGVIVGMEQDGNGGVEIVEVFDGSPAQKAGIQEGDVIKAVDGVDVTGKNTSEIVQLIKENDSDSVEIKVEREGSEITFNPEISTVETPTVSYSMMDGNIGYIKLIEFDGVSTQQFSEAVNDLKSQNMEKLVIDIRDNPGGRLDVVCDILDLFVDKGKLIVYTKDKNGNKEEQYTKYDASVKDIQISILVNGNSASAAEVFTGVMQDYGLAKIVGTQTFGKGIVQRLIELGDGSAIKLTVSKYYLPNDENIHGQGITPDYVIEAGENDENDVQLQKAIEVLN